jgi:hypothetical protein
MFHFMPSAGSGRDDRAFYRWVLRRQRAAHDEDSPPRVPSELEIKQAVRERDGLCCQDCGMTSEDHFAKYETLLHVHRLVPGMPYDQDWCVTLCRECHAKKPKKTEEGFWAADLRWFGLNLYDAEQRELWGRVMAYCREYDVCPSDMVFDAIRARLDNEPINYCI